MLLIHLLLNSKLSKLKKLSKQYGLDESPAMLQLTSMMATGKIENVPTKEGLESLRIDEAKVILHVESQEENGKGRKLSNDEDKIIECRNELQAVAEAEQEKLVSSEKGKSCDSDMESNSDNDSDMESDSDTESIQSGNAELALFSENMKERVGILERQILDILNRLDNQDSEKKDARQIIDKDFQEMLAKIWLLEKENRALSDENLALKLENSEIKEIFIKSVHENNDKKKDISQLNQKKCRENTQKIEQEKETGSLESPWKFPGQTARQQQQQQQQQVICKNRFSVLADLENKREEQKDLQKTKEDSIWGVQTKVPRVFEPRMSQATYRKMPDNEYISGNRLPAIYNNIETSEQTMAIGNRYEVLQNENAVNNYRGNKYNELPMPQTEKSKVGDRVAREFNSAPKGIPGKYGKRAEEEMDAIDSHEERFVATGKNIMPGIYDYNEVVKMRPTQVRAGPPRNYGTSGKKVYGNAQERQDQRGNQSQRKPTLTIIGDSMVKKIRSQDINNECPSYKSYVKTFPGARIDDMFSYVEPTVNMNPSMVVLMCGTNNLRDEEPDRIANKLVDLALTVNERVDKVAVSSIVHRADSHNLEVKRKEVNRLVRESLENHGIDFIAQDNIKAQHLNKWGLHLNYNGNNLLAGNFIDFINSTV